MPSEKDELLKTRPLLLLDGDALSDESGNPHPELAGTLASAALHQFEAAGLAPQELQTLLASLDQTLSTSLEKDPAARYAGCLEESLDLIARLLAKQPNEVMEGWMQEFEVAIESEADLKAVLAHLRAVVMVYTRVLALKG